MDNLIVLITPTTIRQTRNAHTTLYNWLLEFTDEVEAINASSWAEVADLDEEYEGEGFKLRIID